MALLVARVAVSQLFICLIQLLTAEIVVRRENEKLTIVPQNITINVTKLDLTDNDIAVLHNTSFMLFKEITNILLDYNSLWKISNGTFQHNPLLEVFGCYQCRIKLLPSSFGPAMSELSILGLSGAIADTGILIWPYFGGFASLKKLYIARNNLLDIDTITLPQKLQLLDVRSDLLYYLPNVSSHRLPVLNTFYLNDNDITHISDGILAGMCRAIKELRLHRNKLIEFGDVTVLHNLGTLYLYNNELETIPDMLGGLPHLYSLRVKNNARMACDRRMCWKRLWDRVRSPIRRTDDVQCMAPPAARGYLLSMISPGFMQCYQGKSGYCLRKYQDCIYVKLEY